MIVTLSDSELAICKLIGNLRTISSRVNDVADAGINTSLETDEDGVMAEFAFCKWRNIFFNPEISPKKHTFDCLLMDKRMDIKSTRHAGGRLLATLKINPDIDVFVLAIISGRDVEFPGYIKASELYKPENIIDVGYGKTYGVAQEDLTLWK